MLVYITKLFNDWNARFFNALHDKNVEAFWTELRYFVVLAFFFIVIAVYRLWFRQILQIAGAPRCRWLSSRHRRSEAGPSRW